MNVKDLLTEVKFTLDENEEMTLADLMKRG